MRSDAGGRGSRRPAVLWISLGVALAAGWAGLLQGCSGEPDATLRPDSLLKAELGLTDADQVYRVSISGGASETLSPPAVELPPGAWLEFVTTDWRVHEVRFEADSLTPEGRTFLERTDQMASPPLVNRDERFLVSFAEAPEARYPFVVEGNGVPAHGVVVVRSNR